MNVTIPLIPTIKCFCATERHFDNMLASPWDVQ